MTVLDWRPAIGTIAQTESIAKGDRDSGKNLGVVDRLWRGSMAAADTLLANFRQA